MAKHLSNSDIAQICDLIDDWDVNTKLTWDALTIAVKRRLRIDTTRQTLYSKNRIRYAFEDVKAIISGNGNAQQGKLSIPPSLKVAAQRLAKKDRTIKRLEEENRQLLEQFIVWQYNAEMHNIRIDQLNAPLPEPKRSKKKATKKKKS